MHPEKMDIVSKYIISSLPEALICHILSFLPTKEAALTSLLSKKWPYLFAFSPNLDFDDSVTYICRNRGESHRTFMDFVDRVLGLQGNSTINKFSLKCGHEVDPAYVSRWITNVIERGVSDLDLRDIVHWSDLISMPASVFVSKSLVRLRIATKYCVLIDVEDVFLPKLKTLHLDSVEFGDGDNCILVKLVSGCHVLEELVLVYICWKGYRNRSVSSKTLKRLTLSCDDWDKSPDSVSFDTPNLVYFEYSDYVADKYEIVNFDSLVEASNDLRMTCDQRAHASHGDMVCNATDLLMPISNVQILYLFAGTLEVLTFCCEQIPVFKNLIHLTIQTHRKAGWELLPALLKNCPNLETLVFDGLHHECTIKCKCLCKFSGEILTCLSSSPVKFLEISRYAESGVENYIEQVKQFLETMPCLEQLTIYYYTSIDDDLIKVSSQLKNHTRVASPNCEIQVIYDKLS